ncbi:MAG: helix-turn-helix domain-containing protein [Candidatus Cloacimonadales bacterium]|nr:helix-turn-helix domain-containing protein [Candidatus Cloacimonadales bacterium]
MENLILELTKLGLNEQEARVYVIMLQKQNITATELSKSARINRTQMYDILSKLIQRGMCTEILGNVKKYSAVDPEKVVEHFRKQVEETRSSIEYLTPELVKLFKKNSEKDDPLDFVKVLRTTKNIYENVMQLVRSAQESVLVFNKPPYAMKPDENEEEICSLHKGVKHRCIYEIETDNRKEFIKKVEYFEKAGESIRIVPDLPMKLLIVDDRYVVFTLKHNGLQGAQFTAMMIEHSDLAKLLKRTFESYWNEGVTVNEYSK